MKHINPKCLTGVLLAVAVLAAGCVNVGPGDSRPERIIAVTSANQLIEFNAGRPERVLARRPLLGTEPGERIVGLDYRPANGRLYAIGSAGQLYTINLASAIADPVGRGNFRTLAAGDVGMAFDPVSDRIRMVNTRGDNLRIHPDTGQVIDASETDAGVQIDSPLAFAKGDAKGTLSPRLTALAYSNARPGAQKTTAYAIDSATGSLVTLGSREDMSPAVSPDSGELSSIGSIGVNLDRGPVSFDLSSANEALLAVTIGGGRSELYRVDLATGVAGRIGRIGIAEVLTAMAIVPAR